MDSDQRNTDLAGWIGADWATEPDLCAIWLPDKPGWWGTNPDCIVCHGTGRVPVPLHQPEYTWRLIHWYGQTEGVSIHVLAAIDKTMRAMCAGILNPEQAAVQIRDLIHAAERQWREQNEKEIK